MCVVGGVADKKLPKRGCRFEFVKLFSVPTTVFFSLLELLQSQSQTFCGVACQFSHDQHRKAFNSLKRGCERVEGAQSTTVLLAAQTVVVDLLKSH